MAITRTTWIDDDGSGTTGSIINNAWLQSLYDQIDVVAVPPNYGTFNMTDVSGANLGILGVARYSAIGGQVFFEVSVQYPATANTAPALLGFLPFMNGATSAALAQGFGVDTRFYIPASANYISLNHPTTLATRKNNELTGAVLILAGTYLTV